MKNTVRLSPIERAATVLLEEKGYAVVPMIPCFATRNKPVHLMALRNTTELLYLKLKETPRPLSDKSIVEQFCHNDAMNLRRLFPLSPGTMAFRREIWIFRDTSHFTRYEVLANEVREVLHV